jgi:AraC family transcriptional regulator of arabinose operon
VAPPRRPETPHSPQPAPLPGEFRRGRKYTNWRPEGSGDWLLLYTLAGAGRIGLADGTQKRLAPAEALLFEPHARQEYGTDPAAGQWHFLWVHFHARAHWRPWLRWPEAAPGIQHAAVGLPAVHQAVTAALRKVLAAARRVSPMAPDLAFNALEEALLWIHAAADSRETGTHGDDRVRRAMDYFADHLDQPFDLAAVARHCGLSPSRLGHLFKDQMNLSLQACCEDMRLQHARELLTRTRSSVKEIAFATGFSDPLYFSKRFRRSFGVSPLACRATAPGPPGPPRLTASG